jgi:hypothetical protein
LLDPDGGENRCPFASSPSRFLPDVRFPSSSVYIYRISNLCRTMCQTHHLVKYGP